MRGTFTPPSYAHIQHPCITVCYTTHKERGFSYSYFSLTTEAYIWRTCSNSLPCLPTPGVVSELISFPSPVCRCVSCLLKLRLLFRPDRARFLTLLPLPSSLCPCMVLCGNHSITHRFTHWRALGCPLNFPAHCGPLTLSYVKCIQINQKLQKQSYEGNCWTTFVCRRLMKPHVVCRKLRFSIYFKESAPCLPGETLMNDEKAHRNLLPYTPKDCKQGSLPNLPKFGRFVANGKVPQRN